MPPKKVFRTKKCCANCGSTKIRERDRAYSLHNYLCLICGARKAPPCPLKKQYTYKPLHIWAPWSWFVKERWIDKSVTMYCGTIENPKSFTAELSNAES